MKNPVRSLKIKEIGHWLGRALSCVIRPSTRRTPLWVSPIPRCSRPRSSSRTVATTRIAPVHSAVNPALGTGSSPAPCMTWETRWAGGPATSVSPTPSTTAPGAAASSPPTCSTWPRPRPATLIGSWPWPSDWWWRTAYPIRPPVGTSGATIASSSPSQPSRTGWRPGGEKGG